MIGELGEDGFVVYTTSVGGSGLGILSPYDHKTSHSNASPETPPDTPSGSVDGETEISEVFGAAFRAQTVSELPRWAHGRGRWLFV